MVKIFHLTLLPIYVDNIPKDFIKPTVINIDKMTDRLLNFSLKERWKYIR